MRPVVALLPDVPIPTTNGGRVELLGFVHGLSRAAPGSMVLITSRDPGTRARALADRLGLEVRVLPRSLAPLAFSASYQVLSRGAVQAPLRQALRQAPDAVVVSHQLPLGTLAARIAPRSDHVNRSHNVEHAYFAELARAARGPRRMYYAFESAVAKREARALARSPTLRVWADISEEDARDHAGLPFVGAARRVIHPSILPPLPEHREPEPNLVAFTGNLHMPNNVDAVLWFVNECWPMVRQRIPRARLVLAGSSPSPAVCLLNGRNGVELLADPTSMEPILQRASVFVNPQRHGSGTSIKNWHAALRGLPIAASASGARGMGWTNGVEALVVEGAPAFADAVVTLLSDPEFAHRMGRDARAAAAKLTDPVRNVERLLEGVE